MKQLTLDKKEARIHCCDYCGRESVKPLMTVACPICQEKIHSHNRKYPKRPICIMGDCARKPQYKHQFKDRIFDFCEDSEAMAGMHGACRDFIDGCDILIFDDMEEED